MPGFKSCKRVQFRGARKPHLVRNSKSESCSAVSDSLRPHGLYSPWNSPGQNTGVGSLSLLQRILPNPGIEPSSPTLLVDWLPAEPPRKPKNLEWVTHPFFSGSSQSRKRNQGLLHCRQTLYQLSYQGSQRLRWNPLLSQSLRWRDDHALIQHSSQEHTQVYREGLGRDCAGINSSWSFLQHLQLIVSSFPHLSPQVSFSPTRNCFGKLPLQVLNNKAQSPAPSRRSTNPTWHHNV